MPVASVNPASSVRSAANFSASRPLKRVTSVPKSGCAPKVCCLNRFSLDGRWEGVREATDRLWSRNTARIRSASVLDRPPSEPRSRALTQEVIYTTDPERSGDERRLSVLGRVLDAGRLHRPVERLHGLGRHRQVERLAQIHRVEREQEAEIGVDIELREGASGQSRDRGFPARALGFRDRCTVITVRLDARSKQRRAALPAHGVAFASRSSVNSRERRIRSAAASASRWACSHR